MGSGWAGRVSVWLELPDETSEAKERRMLLEAWLLWATAAPASTAPVSAARVFSAAGRMHNDLRTSR